MIVFCVDFTGWLFTVISPADLSTSVATSTPAANKKMNTVNSVSWYSVLAKEQG